jgi:copper chaperone NosL
MNRNARTLAGVLAGALSLLPACRRADDAGPPELRVGRDECHECGMLVAEDRCPGAAIVWKHDERVPVVFDDIGCLVDYRIMLSEGKGEAGERVEACWVRDYNARVWLDANQAVFLAADREKLRTPMGTGIVAFATREEAEVLRAAAGGRIVTLDELQQERAR